jgi:hypothetical protein
MYPAEYYEIMRKSKDKRYIRFKMTGSKRILDIFSYFMQLFGIE